ncbi:MAG: hypothetical protein HYX20_01875 [Candidatus Yanofskybacteria bacterium]|nr:hypothetical protein [Candidatus Yanofskybacteria bacterium]
MKSDHSQLETRNQKLETRIISWSGQLHYYSNVRVTVLAATVLFAIAALVQIFQKNIITTIFFAMLGTVLLLNAKNKQELGEFEINPAGIKTNNNLLRYKELKSFWIEYDPVLDIKELSLQTKKWYLPYVKIPITGQNPVQIRLALLEFLPEIEHKDTLVEILARKLGI